MKRDKIKLLNNKELLLVLAGNALWGIILFFIASKYGSISNFFNIFVAFIILFYNFIIYYKCSEQNKVELILIITWELTLIIELIYRFYRFDATPYRMLYIPDFFVILLFFELINQKKIKINFVVILILLLLFCGIFSSLINLRNIQDLLHGIVIIIRFLALYLYSYSEEIKIPKWMRYVFILNILAFLAETLLKFNVDFRNGIFGYEYVGGLFQLFLMMWISKSIFNDSEKNNFYIVIKLLIVELIMVLREAKVECLLLVLWMFIVVVIINKRKPIKMILYSIVIFFIGVIGWKLIPVFNPKWGMVFSNWTFFEIVEGGLNKSLFSSGYITIFEYLNKINFSFFNYVFGLGLGAAQPPTYFRLLYLPISGVSGFPKSIWMSSMISSEYLNWPNYLIFFRGINSIIIDLGYFGLLLFLILIINFFIKSIKLCNSKRKDAALLGSIGIWQTMYIFYRVTGSYNILVVPLAMIVSGVLAGMIEYECKKEKEIQKNEN